MPNDKKKVVYLFGAGATQAEVSNYSSSIKILMSDIVDGMAQKISINNITALKEVSNLLSIPDIDVEHLITLYEASGTKKHNKVEKKIKKLFREEIEEKIDQLGEKTKITPLVTIIYLL